MDAKRPVALADGDSELPAAALEIAAVEELAADAETDGVRAADAPPAELSAATEVEPRAETPEAAELSAEMFSADERARLEQQALALQAAEQEFAQEIAADATVQHETGTALASQAAGMSEEERAIVEKRMLAILGFRRETEGASVLHDAEQECAQALAALRLQAPCNAKAEDLEEAAAGTTAPEPCLSQPGVGAEPEAELEIVPAEAAEPKEMTDEERAIVEQVARALQAAELSAAAEEVEPGTEMPQAAPERSLSQTGAGVEQDAAVEAAELEIAPAEAAEPTMMTDEEKAIVEEMTRALQAAEPTAAAEVEPGTETPEAAKMSAEMFSAEERAMLEQQALALQAAEQEFAQEIAADATRSQVEADGATPAGAAASEAGPEHDLAVEPAATVQPETGTAMAPQAAEMSAPPEAGAGVEQDLAAEDTELEIVPAEAAEPTTMTDEEKAIVEQMTRLLQASEAELAEEGLAFGAAGAQAAVAALEPRGAEEPQGTESVERKQPPVHATPQKPLAKPSPSPSPQLATPSSGWSWFGSRKAEEPKAEEPQDAPDISSEMCANILRDIDAILQDGTRKKASLVKVLQEARDKVREVDEKAQGASNEAKLLSCAAVLKAGVQTAELKHKTLSVKGLELLRRLASYKAMQAMYFPAVAKALRACATCGEVAIQLKVLQVCAAVAETDQMIAAIGPALSIMEAILLVMGASTSGASMAAEATLHQAVMASLTYVEACDHRYERVLETGSPAGNLDKAHGLLEQGVDVLAQVLNELMVLCSSKASERLKYSKPERGNVVALFVMQDVVRSRAAVLTKFAPLRSVFVNSVCPILLKQLQRIGAGTLRLLPREEPRQYSKRVALAVSYLNTVSALVSSLPQAEDPHKSADPALLTAITNLLAVLVTMAQEANPSWVRLAALEVLQDFCTAPALAYRARHIFMFCRSFDELQLEGSTSSPSTNILVSLIQTLEALVVKLLDEPGADAGAAAAKVLTSEKLGLHKKNAPLVTLTRSLIVAPREGDEGRWVRGLEALKFGDLSSLGGGQDGVLTPQEISKNKTARAVLVECVRAEMALMCSMRLMQSMASMCGVVNWRHRASKEDAVSIAQTANKDDEQIAANAEACWHLMRACAPSFIKVSQVALKAVDAQPLVRAMASATSSLAQAATVLQMVQIRDLCFNCLCAFAEAGMAEIPGLDFTRSLSELPSAEVAKQRGMLEMYAPAVWDWRRSLLTQELLGLLLEAAAEMYEAWSIVLPVLQRLHFELAARVRVERATGDERPELSAPASPSDPVANVEPVSAQSSGADAGAAAAPLASISGDGEADGMRGISASSLLASLDALFSTTTVLADGALVELIEGLARLAPIMPSTLAPSPADAETEDGDTLGAPPPPAAVPVSTVGDGRWGMQQTLLVARQNFFRLHVIWEAVLKMAHLASYPRGWIRDFGAKSMVQLAHDALIFLSGPESLSDEAAAASRSARDGQADKATECRVMASYEVMYASPYSDVRHTVLAGLQGLLQSCASKQMTLTSGWRPLLGLLASVPHGKTEPSLMREAVACLEVICQSLLSHLAPEDVEALAKSLKAMASQEADQPSALGAIVLLRQLASFLTANRDTLVARLLPPADQLAHPRGQDHARAEKETEVLRAVEGKANLILDMIIQDVLSSLFSLVLDWRVKVREDAMKGVFTLLTEDDYLAEPARLTQICRRQMMPLLDAVAKQVESCEEDGSLCWQQWLATWLSLVQGVPVLLENSLPALPSDADSARQQAREGGSGDGGPEKARGDGKGEGGVRGSGGEREMEWLGAWEGLLDRLTLAWVCGNLFVLRAAIQGIMVPLGRSAALMPRAGWDLVWDKMPVLLVAALRTSTARDSGQVPNSRRVLPGHVMASVVVEELLQVCAQPDVRRDAGCLAGQLSLVSARNMRTLIQLVGAATIDFRSSSPDSPVSMSADARQPPETRREHATRLYTALARAASDRSNLQEALDLWSQIIWSLLRHLPCVTREEMKMRQDQKWCAGLVFPDYLQALAAGFACPDLAADVLAKLLYEELQEHEAVLRGVWETTTVAMLVAMCSRHRGALFRHWAPVASAFAVVLLVSVKVLGSPGDAAAAKSPQLNGQEHEGGAQELVDEEAKMVDDDEARRIGLVQRLTGGMQAFLVPPADPATKSEEGLPDEEQQVARVEAQVVLALVRHVIPCARGAQIREDLMYMLDSLVGAACSPGAQGRRNSLACNCLEGLLSLADARGMQPLPQTPAPASAPSSPAAPAGNSVTGAPSTASDVPSTCTSSSSTQPSCVSPWADTQVATVNMAAKIAIERCRAILVAYLAMETVLNERLLALPGVRGTRSFKSHDDRTAGGSLRVSAEVALKAMEGLERLRLHPSTFRFLVHALEDRVAIPSPAAGGEEEEVEDEEEEGEAALWLPSMCKEQCLRLVSEGLEEEHAARVMSRGHLLLLFSTIVDTVASENRVLRQMAQSMLRTVALDIRLVTIC